MFYTFAIKLLSNHYGVKLLLAHNKSFFYLVPQSVHLSPFDRLIVLDSFNELAHD